MLLARASAIAVALGYIPCSQAQEDAETPVTLPAPELPDYCSAEPDMDCYVVGTPWCCNDPSDPCTEETEISCEVW